MADLVLHTGHSVLFGDSFGEGDGDVTFSSGPIDSPPKIKQACAVCVVKTTACRVHDYDDVKLVPFEGKSGMLVSDVSDNVSRNSEGGSSAAIAICEALLDIEAADAEVAAKKASMARAKLALLKAKSGSSAGSLRSRSRIIRSAEPRGSPNKSDGLESALSKLMEEDFGDTATVPDPEKEPSLRNPMEPVLDRDFLKVWDISHPPQPQPVPVCAAEERARQETQHDADKLSRYEATLAQRAMFEVNTHQVGFEEAVARKNDAILQDLLVQAEDKVLHHEMLLSATGGEILRAEQQRMYESSEAAVHAAQVLADRRVAESNEATRIQLEGLAGRAEDQRNKILAAERQKWHDAAEAQLLAERHARDRDIERIRVERDALADHLKGSQMARESSLRSTLHDYEASAEIKMRNCEASMYDNNTATHQALREFEANAERRLNMFESALESRHQEGSKLNEEAKHFAQLDAW